MKYKRHLLTELSQSSKSLLLLGPRQTGKSTLLKSLNPDLSINLARENTFLEFSSQPDLLEKVVKANKAKNVFLDEVQRIPSLLNTIQAIIDDHREIKFYLSGSSARKLRRGNANLLPGRITAHRLGPLLVSEIGADLNLTSALIFGTLPGIWTEKEKKQKKAILKTYASTYLKEEIQAEALTKNIEGFSRFLFVAASKSGEFLDYAKLGALAGITQKTSSRFFEILEDTLIVYRIESYAKNLTRRLVQHPKFYFFDNGVLNGLLNGFNMSADRKGFLFEHFIVSQIINMNLTFGENARLSTYRTESGSEVDLLLERDGKLIALEIKSATRLRKKDFTGLQRIEEAVPTVHRRIMLYGGSIKYSEGKIDVLPWREALNEIELWLR